jgi:hypothetical protein
MSIYSSWKKLQGSGFSLYYPSSWSTENIDPISVVSGLQYETRFIPKMTTENIGGIITLRYSKPWYPGFGSASSYYGNPTYVKTQNSQIFTDYCKTISGLSITSVSYDDLVIPSLGQYIGWDWLIYFQGNYNDHSGTGYYLFKIKTDIMYSFLNFSYIGDGSSINPSNPDDIYIAFSRLFHSFRFE